MAWLHSLQTSLFSFNLLNLPHSDSLPLNLRFLVSTRLKPIQQRCFRRPHSGSKISSILIGQTLAPFFHQTINVKDVRSKIIGSAWPTHLLEKQSYFVNPAKHSQPQIFFLTSNQQWNSVFTHELSKDHFRRFWQAEFHQTGSPRTPPSFLKNGSLMLAWKNNELNKKFMQLA